MRKLSKAEFFDENYAFGITRIIEGGAEVETHTHEFTEICYVAKGGGFHEVNGYTCEVRRGDLFIIDLESGHRFFSDGGGLVTYNVMFENEIIDNAIFDCREFNKFRAFKHFFPRLSPKCDLHFAPDEQNETEIVCAAMYKELEEKKPGYIAVIKGFLTVFLARIMRGLSAYSSEDLEILYSSNHKIISEIIENIRQNYQHKLNLDELARISLFSKGHLCNVFKRETGMTLSEYINSVRIAEACKVIEAEPNVNLSELADKIGFGDYKRFYKVFKDITGMTPREKRDTRV